MLTPLIKSRTFAALVHLGLWVLLYLIVTQFGGKTPPLKELEGRTGIPQSPAPVARLPKLFTGVTWPNSFADPAALNPFYTRFFVPAPAPAPPPPATTRRITLTYQGFYSTGGAAQQVIYKASEGFVVATVGAQVATNLYIASANAFGMVLTNTSAQTNLLELNKPGIVEVPIQ